MGYLCIHILLWDWDYCQIFCLSYFIWPSQSFYKLSITVPNIQMRKLKSRKIEWLFQGHTAMQWQSGFRSRSFWFANLSDTHHRGWGKVLTGILSGSLQRMMSGTLGWCFYVLPSLPTMFPLPLAWDSMLLVIVGLLYCDTHYPLKNEIPVHNRDLKCLYTNSIMN